MYSIIWDLDGTLFNTWELHKSAIKETGKSILGKEISTLQIVRMQSSLVNQSIFNLFGVECYEEAKKCYVYAFLNLLYNDSLIDTVDIVSYLEILKNKYGVQNYLFTGRDSVTTNEMLKYFSLDKMFKKIICIDNFNYEKKSEFYLHKVFKTLHNPIYITDDKNEVKYFTGFDIKTYHACWFNQSTKACKDGFTLTNVSDLDIILGGENERIFSI